MPTPRVHATDADRQRAYRQRREKARADLLASKNLPPLPVVAAMPGTARWRAMRDQARLILQNMADEMQSYHDDRSETWQEGEKAAAMLETIGSLESIIGDIDGLEL